MFDRNVIDAARAHAVWQYPREACGLVLKSGYLPCENLAEDPTKDFRIGEEALLEHDGEILAVYHSHPDGPDYPSESDMRGQIATDVPWGISVSTSSEASVPFWFGDGAPKAPLVGRGFRHGVTDCYSLIRDWYLIERGIKLVEIPREWEWWLAGGDLYTDWFAKAGFRRISLQEARRGDLFTIRIKSKVANHGGVYLEEGGLVLHHMGNSGADMRRLSKRDPIYPYVSRICDVLRWGDE